MFSHFWWTGKETNKQWDQISILIQRILKLHAQLKQEVFLNLMDKQLEKKQNFFYI